MSDRFDILPTPLEGLTVVQRKPLPDGRGFFERMYCTQDLEPVLGRRSIVQINHTHTASMGTVRGLHYQKPPHAEAKLVSCLRGQVYDVAVDLRRNSPTYMQWHAEVLSEDNHRSLFIPEGFAHGFQAMTNDCEMLYLHTAAYAPESEAGYYVLDPRLAVRWPLPVHSLSVRDAALPMMGDPFAPVTETEKE